MDFPSWKPELITEYPEDLVNVLGVKEIVAVYQFRDLLVELPSESDVLNAKPDFTALKKMGQKVIITAPGKTVDFVSRFFAPVAGIDEDPVTGSAHTTLIPYWSKRLGKTELTAMQLSQRVGHLKCKFMNDRVEISGNGKIYLVGEIFLD